MLLNENCLTMMSFIGALQKHELTDLFWLLPQAIIELVHISQYSFNNLSIMTIIMCQVDSLRRENPDGYFNIENYQISKISRSLC